MPWTKLTYDELTYGQKQMFNIFYQAKRDNIDVNWFIDDLQIRTEFGRRDFTKRQMNILVFIYNYSIAFGKKWALIPKMKDFESGCGISAIKIRKELELLVDMDIISWDQEENLFTIKEPHHWLAPTINTFSYDRSQELFMLNLKHGNIYGN